MYSDKDMVNVWEINYLFHYLFLLFSALLRTESDFHFP